MTPTLVVLYYYVDPFLFEFFQLTNSINATGIPVPKRMNSNHLVTFPITPTTVPNWVDYWPPNTHSHEAASRIRDRRPCYDSF